MSSYPQISMWVVKSQTIIIEKPLRLSCGLVISEPTMGFESFGTLNDSATDAILVCHAVSGNHHAARWYNVDKKPGWWNHYIGASKAIVTEKFFIIWLGNLGTCHGSTAAHATNPKKWGLTSPRST